MNKQAYDKTGLVYGMGHAVYTLSDPRAVICKRFAEKLAVGTEFEAKIVNKQAYDKTGLVYGMGHAVYTLSDPRAVICKRFAEKLAVGTEFEAEYRLLESIERLAPEVILREKGTKKDMCANVDMYSGFVYSMMGIPSDLYTPLFACARHLAREGHEEGYVRERGYVLGLRLLDDGNPLGSLHAAVRLRPHGGMGGAPFRGDRCRKAHHPSCVQEHLLGKPRVQVDRGALIAAGAVRGRVHAPAISACVLFRSCRADGARLLRLRSPALSR